MSKSEINLLNGTLLSVSSPKCVSKRSIKKTARKAETAQDISIRKQVVLRKMAQRLLRISYLQKSTHLPAAAEEG